MTLRAIGRAHLQHRAELLVEQALQDSLVHAARKLLLSGLPESVHVLGERVEGDGIEVDRHAAAAGEGHLADGREEPAVGAVVVGEHELLARELLDRAEEAPSAVPARRDRGGSSPSCVDLRERRAAQPVAPRPGRSAQLGLARSRCEAAA
jgi:hypothetical protein